MDGKIQLQTIDDLIALWPSEAEFARESGLKPSHVATMKVRGNIPSTYWPSIIKAAGERASSDKRFKAVTAASLLEIQTGVAAT